MNGNGLWSVIANLAPRALTQPILPGWVFGNVITVTEENSRSPSVERDIVAKISYGRQLGQILDALAVLIEEKHGSAPQDEALRNLLDLKRQVDDIKAESADAIKRRVEQDLAKLKKLQGDDEVRTWLAASLAGGAP